MRVQSLDALRGVAALVVVVHHCVLATTTVQFPSPPDSAAGAAAFVFYRLPLLVVTNGPAAVLVFFVLSGYVLALSPEESSSRNYRTFVVARFCRIWLPFAAVITAAELVTYIVPLGPVGGTCNWFAESWRTPVSAKEFLVHLAMSGTATQLDGSMWSLVHELRVSLVFPWLVEAVVWNWFVALMASIALALACTRALGDGSLPGVVSSLISTVQYVPFFVLGIVLAVKAKTIERAVLRLRPTLRNPLWMVALVGLCLTPERVDHILTTEQEWRSIAAGFFAGLLVLLCAIGGRNPRILSWRVPLHLGRISYSLYLVHVVVILTVVHTFDGVAPVWMLLVLSALVSIALADTMQRYIEVPAARLGRSWAYKRRPLQLATIEGRCA